MKFFNTLDQRYPNGLGFHATSAQNEQGILLNGLHTGEDGNVYTKIIDPARDPRSELRTCIANGNAVEAYDRLRLGIRLALGYGQKSFQDRLAVVLFEYSSTPAHVGNHRPMELPSVVLQVGIRPGKIKEIFNMEDVEENGDRRLETPEEMANRIARKLIEEF